MADRRNRSNSKKATNDWLTPPRVIELAGLFDLDPCAYRLMPWRTARQMVSLTTLARSQCLLRWKIDGVHPNKATRARCHCKECLWRSFGKFAPDVIDNGLNHPWYGRVWLNPPWNEPLPWAEKMAKHGNGLMLTSAKSTDTNWAHVILNYASAILFFKGRLLYHYPSGRRSTGGWTPSMLAAFGEANIDSLRKVQQEFPGVIYRKD